MTEAWNRRHFIRGTACGLVLLASRNALAWTPSPATIPPWQPGFLEIHHIATGRGNSVFVLAPDGTSILIDAGAVAATDPEALGPARPNASRRPGEWIARYCQRRLAASGARQIDYAVLTHLHGDHIGDVTPASPASRAGTYKLTGISDVAELLPFRRLLDRGFPDYAFPTPQTLPSALNYIRFAQELSRRGAQAERFQPGSSTQIGLLHEPARYPGFTVRNLAASGELWTGDGSQTRRLFPDPRTLPAGQQPSENACSIALRIGLGNFRYYIGGDLTADTRFGSQPWMDVESPVSAVAGPVSAAALNHHGYFDATGPAFVRNMRARIYILQAWHASHPALAVLDALYSPVLEAGAHDVFCTGLVPAARLADSRLSDRMLSQHGHTVIRVQPDGTRYEVLVLDDSTEDDLVLQTFGPYTV